MNIIPKNIKKHIYIGSQRIVSKLGDLESFGADPRRVEYASHDVSNVNLDFADKYSAQTTQLESRYKALGADFNLKTLNDYVNGQSFCCGESSLSELHTSNTNTLENAQAEQNLYYYHPDHLGSTSLITNLDGEIVQNVAYIPFGEVFVEERNGSYSTSYLFNAKELDSETGLYYYGARYLDPTGAMWLSVDPLWEKYVGMTPYNYCAGNPVKLVDTDGKDATITGEHSDLYVSLLQHKCKGITLSINDEGKLAYTRNLNKKNKMEKLNSTDEIIKKIVDDKNVNVNIQTVPGNYIITGDVKRPIFGGSFLGNVVNTEKNHVEAYQAVNVWHLRRMDKLANVSQGTSPLHELTEAYEGALISLSRGVSSPMAGEDGSVYTEAHNKATFQPELRRIFLDMKGNESRKPNENSVSEKFEVKENMINGFQWHEITKVPYIR